MQNLITSFKVSLENCRKVRVLTVAAMLIALTVILNFAVIFLGPSLKISFSFVPIASGSMLFGPVIGGVIGALSDIVGWFIKPVGPYMPFLTISGLLTGIIYGIFLFNKKITLKNIFFAQFIITVFINSLVNYSYMLLFIWNGVAKKTFFVYLGGRLAVQSIVYAVNAAVCLLLLPLAANLRAVREAGKKTV